MNGRGAAIRCRRLKVRRPGATSLPSPFVEQGLLAALNPAVMRYRVAFHMVTRARQHRTDIVEAFLEDMKAAHAIEAEK